jgi:hypothetical protein
MYPMYPLCPRRPPGRGESISGTASTPYPIYLLRQASVPGAPPDDGRNNDGYAEVAGEPGGLQNELRRRPARNHHLRRPSSGRPAALPALPMLPILSPRQASVTVAPPPTTVGPITVITPTPLAKARKGLEAAGLWSPGNVPDVPNVPNALPGDGVENIGNIENIGNAGPS